MKSFKEHCMDIISNTYSGNADSARTSINEVLNLKATEYMNGMKQDLAEGILQNEDVESLDEGKVDPYTAHEILKQTGGVDKDHYALKPHELETRWELAKKHGYTPRGDSPLGRSKQYRVTLHLQRQAAKLQNEDIESLNEGKEANPNNVRELVLHADNDRHLYHSSTVPIQKNLERKFKKGSYDHEKAKTLWKYHADRAADSYAKQYGSAGQKGHHIFSPADRHAAAKEFADAHHEEMKAGNFQS